MPPKKTKKKSVKSRSSSKKGTSKQNVNNGSSYAKLYNDLLGNLRKASGLSAFKKNNIILTRIAMHLVLVSKGVIPAWYPFISDGGVLKINKTSKTLVNDLGKISEQLPNVDYVIFEVFNKSNKKNVPSIFFYNNKKIKDSQLNPDLFVFKNMAKLRKLLDYEDQSASFATDTSKFWKNLLENKPTTKYEITFMLSDKTRKVLPFPIPLYQYSSYKKVLDSKLNKKAEMLSKSLTDLNYSIFVKHTIIIYPKA